jgi:hypothetical protein
MVKTTVPEVPPVVLTVTVTGPGVAVAGIANVAVIWLTLTTVTLLTVTPPVTFTVAPVTKLEPAKVTLTVLPTVPALGLIEVRTGVGGSTVNTTGEDVPPEVVTATFVAPSVALLAIINIAVIWEVLDTTTLLTVTPGLLTVTLAPGTKLVPVSVTGTAVPCTPVVGLIDSSVGGSGLMVSENGAVANALLASVTCMVKFDVPKVVGVPTIRHTELWRGRTARARFGVGPKKQLPESSDRPAGSEPAI